MPAETFGARPAIYRNGQRLADDVEEHVQRVVVQSDMHAPDSCQIVLTDPERTLLDQTSFEFLDTVKVTSGRPGEDREDPVFEGQVYSLEFDYADHGAVLVIGAFDKSYALYNGLHTKTYSNVTDSDLAQQIAKDAGLEAGTIESTSIVHQYIAQINETHFEFLARRAAEIGYELRTVGKKLHFNKTAVADDGPAPASFDTADRFQLVPGANLEQFTSRITAAQQVSEVEVRGWDVNNKKSLVSTAPAATRSAALHDTPKQIGDKNGSPRAVTIDLPLGTQAECDAAVVAESERLASTFAHAEGVCHGDPRLLAGSAVSVGQTGGRFDGKYTITSARHVFGRSGYRTHFAVTGRHDRSVFGMLGNRTPSAPAIGGVVIAVVTNASDPDGLGRVKLKFPWLADDYESDWARVLQLGAGSERGFSLLPEVNDEVLVAFEQGDTRRPYVIGGLYNGTDKPAYDDAVDKSSGKVQKRALKTRAGHELVFTDSDGKESIELHTPDRKVAITLDHANGKLEISTDKDVTIHAGGNASIKADQNITIEAGQSASIKAGTSLKLEGSTDVTIKGGVIKLN